LGGPSEGIVNLAVSPHASREQREDFFRAIGLGGQAGSIVDEQRHADEDRSIEDQTDAYREIATFDLADRRWCRADTLGEFALRPASLRPRFSDAGTEQPPRRAGDRVVGARDLHDEQYNASKAE
jgi:hypothetical protein